MSAPMCVVAEKKLASSCYHYFLRLESGTWDILNDYFRSVLLGGSYVCTCQEIWEVSVPSDRRKS